MDLPAQAARGRFAAAGDNNRCREFAVDRPQVRRRIPDHGTAKPDDLADHALELVAVELSQQAVGFDVAIDAIRGEPDKGTGREQAAKAIGIGTAGGCAVLASSE